MQMSNRSSTGHDATGESNWKVTGKPGRHIGVTGCLRVSQGVSGCRGSCSRSYRSDLFGLYGTRRTPSLKRKHHTGKAELFNPSQLERPKKSRAALSPEGSLEFRQECRKYGAVIKVFADQGSSKGDALHSDHWIQIALIRNDEAHIKSSKSIVKVYFNINITININLTTRNTQSLLIGI